MDMDAGPSLSGPLPHLPTCRSAPSTSPMSSCVAPSLPPFLLSLPPFLLSLASLSLQAIVVSFGMAFWATCVQYKMCSFWMGVSLVNTQLVYETGQMMVRTITSLSRPYLPRPLSI